MSWWERLEAWFFAAMPRRHLELARIAIGGFIAAYLGIRLRFFLALAEVPSARWEPVGVLAPFRDPWPDAMVVALVLASLLLAILFMSGVRFRVAGPALTLTLLLLFTYRSSWGQLLHFENLMLLQVGLLSLADAGRKSGSNSARGDSVSAWPVRLITLVTVLTYVLAGWAKVRFGGLSWLFGDTLRNHVASANVRLEVLGEPSSPIGRWLVGQPWLFPPLAITTVAIELGALVAFVNRRLRYIWIGAAWLMHLGIAATMFIVFPMPFFFVAFIPFLLAPD